MVLPSRGIRIPSKGIRSWRVFGAVDCVAGPGVGVYGLIRVYLGMSKDAVEMRRILGAVCAYVCMYVCILGAVEVVNRL